MQDGPGGVPADTRHTGATARFESAWLDESGRLFIATDLGFGIVHTLDMGIAADAVEAGLWNPVDVTFQSMPEQFGYTLVPGHNPPPLPASFTAAG